MKKLRLNYKSYLYSYKTLYYDYIEGNEDICNPAGP